jgi:hypothetical protein
MTIKPFIPKDDPDIPDWYEINIMFNDKSSKEIEAVLSRFVKVDGESFFEVLTNKDNWQLFNKDYIKEIQFDKNYTKLLELKRMKDVGQSEQSGSEEDKESAA